MEGTVPIAVSRPSLLHLLNLMQERFNTFDAIAPLRPGGLIRVIIQ